MAKYSKRTLILVIALSILFIVAFFFWGFECKWNYYSMEVDGQKVTVDGPEYNYEKMPKALHVLFTWNKSIKSCR